MLSREVGSSVTQISGIGYFGWSFSGLSKEMIDYMIETIHEFVKTKQNEKLKLINN